MPATATALNTLRHGATANLLAPVPVNHRARRAFQVVLDAPTLSLRAPLVTA